MSSFFRKRPPYQPREEHTIAQDDDFPIVGPASEDYIEDDFPVLNPTQEEEDFPIVKPDNEYGEAIPTLSPAAASVAPVVERAVEHAVAYAPTAAPTPAIEPTKRQFHPSNKLRLPEVPSWVQEQAESYGQLQNPACDLPNTTPIQLQNAIQVIINNEMAEAEKRIKQKVLDELKNYFENR